MKRLFFVINCIISVLLVSAASEENGPIRLRPSQPGDIDIEEHTPDQNSVYCILYGNEVLIYSPNSVMAEVLLYDMVRGNIISSNYANLSDGTTFNISCGYDFKVIVRINNLQYEAVISTLE